MRRLCALQVVLAVHIGWFYMTKLALDNYPGAYSVSRDGPFKTKADCDQQRNHYEALAQSLGLSIKFSQCMEQGDA